MCLFAAYQRGHAWAISKLLAESPNDRAAIDQRVSPRRTTTVEWADSIGAACTGGDGASAGFLTAIGLGNAGTIRRSAGASGPEPIVGACGVHNGLELDPVALGVFVAIEVEGCEGCEVET